MAAVVIFNMLMRWSFDRDDVDGLIKYALEVELKLETDEEKINEIRMNQDLPVCD